MAYKLTPQTDTAAEHAAKLVEKARIAEAEAIARARAAEWFEHRAEHAGEALGAIPAASLVYASTWRGATTAHLNFRVSTAQASRLLTCYPPKAGTAPKMVLDGHATKVEWETEHCHVTAEIPRYEPGIPRIRADTRQVHGVTFYANVSVDTQGAEGLYVPYSSGERGPATTLGSFHLGERYPGAIARMLLERQRADDAAMADETAAYLREALAPFNPAAYPRAEPYPTGEKAAREGSVAQHAALSTPHARKMCALAKRYPRAYAELNNMPMGDYGFDHYRWAKRFLEAAGVQPDPGLLWKGRKGKIAPYSYGSAWLPTAEEQARLNAENAAELASGQSKG